MKNRIPLIAALVLGVIAVLFIRSYIQRVEDEAAARLRGRPVVSARVNIPEGAAITEAMLMPKEVPAQFIPPQAIEGTAELRQIIGRRTRVPLAAGQAVLWSDLEVERRGGLAVLIPEGERAFTAPITAGVPSTLLQSNDRVDILGLFTLPQEGEQPRGGQAAWRESSDLVCVVLLQNVSILAVGENLTGLVRPGDTQSGGDLTFAVTLQEAQLLMFAGQHGQLGVALRGEGEVEMIEREQLPKVTFQALETVIGSLDEKRSSRVVEIMRGRDREERELIAD